MEIAAIFPDVPFVPEMSTVCPTFTCEVLTLYRFCRRNAPAHSAPRREASRQAVFALLAWGIHRMLPNASFHVAAYSSLGNLKMVVEIILDSMGTNGQDGKQERIDGYEGYEALLAGQS
ncbi:MAG TPA: hypothetical protein VFN53_06340 [Acidobacteriaceae bacterium]|nr:hypothetical protein [Acidobacteriaceae bacterium]